MRAINVLQIVCATAWATPSGAQAEMTREQLIGVIQSAQELFEKECGLTIMQGRLPGDVNCGQGQETIGEAWDRALVKSGLPADPDERTKLAADLGLDSTASLVLMGMARAEGIQYLLEELQAAQ